MISFAVGFLLLAFIVLAPETTAKKYGGGFGGGSKFKPSTGGTGGLFGGSKASVPAPVRTSGAGYASSSKFVGTGGYGRYPRGGYSPFLFAGFFLYPGYRRRNPDSNGGGGDSDFEEHFERLENGCQLVGIESYRTLDDHNVTEWDGCSEEWRYLVEVIEETENTTSDVASSGTQRRTFVSPPLELYACDTGDLCGECSDDLRGADFDALTLEVLDYPNTTHAVDCWVPRDTPAVTNETYECLNDECIFLSEKYASGSFSSSSAFLLHGVVVVAGGIAMALYGFW